mmetsp:Transcript_3038/g.9285  ORF Transcript_3038/g.9285 Transcript_3038/m.9285 type:complete len:151 (-) Transcript_3038:126-578(-)
MKASQQFATDSRTQSLNTMMGFLTSPVLSVRRNSQVLVGLVGGESVCGRQRPRESSHQRRAEVLRVQCHAEHDKGEERAAEGDDAGREEDMETDEYYEDLNDEMKRRASTGMDISDVDEMKLLMKLRKEMNQADFKRIFKDMDPRIGEVF